MLFPFDRESPAGGASAPPMTAVPEPRFQADPASGTRYVHLGRRRKLRRSVEKATEEWRQRQERAEDRIPPLEQLPHPPGLGVAKGQPLRNLPPRRREELFEAGIIATMRRLLLWLKAGGRFFFGVVGDKLRGRDSEQRRAERLRETFEAMGTTFIKVGQQLSMRLDLLPYTYTRELESMLDNVAAIPPEEAIRTIERASGKSLDQIFQAFDPNPIGSASVACVYQAILTTGERVAVKVRRPRIGELLAADMRALSWLMEIAELFYLRPGFTANFVAELRGMLFEELDFVREARFNELYRRRMRKTKQLRFVTAPRIFFEHSNTEVLVAEFVSGTWISEIIDAIETGDTEALARLREMNIDPVLLARRIQLIARFNNFENIFFHADLHPANILIQPDNHIVLIDFGSCGSFSRRELNSWRRWFDAQSVNDVAGMAQAALGIIEPLPPIDRETFAQRLEAMFWNDLYAIKSKHAEWWERISARLWIGFLKLSREFGVPMRLNTLRMIRASMLADTIAGRLDHDQDPYREYRRYEIGAGKRAKRKLMKRLHWLAGPSKFTRINTGIEALLKLGYRVQRAVDSLSSIGIIPLIGKAVEAAREAIKTILYISIAATAYALAILAYRFVTRAAQPDTFVHLWLNALRNGWFQIAMLMPILNSGRRISLRMKHEHDQGDSGGTNNRIL